MLVKKTHILPQDREVCMCTTVRTLARQTTAIYQSYLKATGLKQPQYGMLARLDRLTRCNLSELAEITDLDITSASRSVRALINAGLVEVSEGKDARTKAYRLSPRGKRALKAAFGLWRQAQDQMRRLVSPKQLKALTNVAETIAASARPG